VTFQERPLPFRLAGPLCFQETVVVCYLMGFRAIGLVGMACLMILGCATKRSVSDARWRAQLARQQETAREWGRIGYIGYQGPAVGRGNVPH
jgi:hypothetical protein